MRRRLLLALAAFPVAAIAVAHGCSSDPPFESACQWLADPENCLREFREDMLKAAVDESNNPFGDCRPVGWTEASPTEANQADLKGVRNGTFLKREALDTCILDKGGFITIDPPLNVNTFPPDLYAVPTTYTIKFTMPNGFECGSATYTSPHGFSFTVNPLPNQDAGAAGTDGGVATGSGGGTTTSSGSGSSADNDDGGAPKPFGTFTSVIQPGRDAFDVTCPSGETHHFNLNEIVGPEGDGGVPTSSCAGLAPLLAEASLQLYKGGIDVDGSLSFAITFPPGDDAPTLGAKNLFDAGPGSPAQKIVFFNCLVPAEPETCYNGVQDPGETDVDCGGPQIFSMEHAGSCPARCMEGQGCLCDADCAMGKCVKNPMSGLRVCDAMSTNASFPTCNYDPNATTSSTTTGSGTGGGGTGGMGTGGADAGP
jgi:hypothetical protein